MFRSWIGFAREGMDHFGVLLTSDQSLPRTGAGIGLLVRSILAFADGLEEDALMNSYDWVPATR